MENPQFIDLNFLSEEGRFPLPSSALGFDQTDQTADDSTHQQTFDGWIHGIRKCVKSHHFLAGVRFTWTRETSKLVRKFGWLYIITLDFRLILLQRFLLYEIHYHTNTKGHEFTLEKKRYFFDGFPSQKTWRSKTFITPFRQRGKLTNPLKGQKWPHQVVIRSGNCLFVCIYFLKHTKWSVSHMNLNIYIYIYMHILPCPIFPWVPDWTW